MPSRTMCFAPARQNISRGSPGKFFDLRLLGMVRIERAQFKFGPVAGQRAADPAAGPTGLKHIARGREIDDLHAARVRRDVPVMRMAVDKGLYLPVPGKHIL